MKHGNKVIILILVSIFLTGCSDTKREENGIAAEETVSAEPDILTVEEQTGDSEEKVNALTEIAPSDKEAEIAYKGEIANLQGAAAGREQLYLYGRTKEGKKGIYIMRAEEETEVRSEAEWADNMAIICMATDEAGKCYAFMMSVNNDYLDYEKMEVLIISPEGKKEEVIDVSDILKGQDWKMRPDEICIDGEGNIYFFSEADVYSIIVVNRQGERIGHLENDAGRYIEGIGRGKNGFVYIVYSTANSYSAARITAEGEITDICEGVLPESVGKYRYIYPGTDSNLLIYGKMSSIYAFNDEAKAEERVSSQDLAFDAYESKVIGFLADGRLVVSYSDNEDNRYFQYIPSIGK